MRKLYQLLFIVVILIAQTNTIFAQQSDYEIIENYKSELSSLKVAANQVSSVKAVDIQLADLNELIVDYTLHRALIDDALYPQTFDGSIEEIKTILRTAEHRWLIIENQHERLNELSFELNSFKNELQIMSQRNDSLRKSLIASEASEERLGALISDYRKSLEERDVFILEMLDSVLIAYERVASIGSSDVNGEYTSGTLLNDENTLSIIESLIDVNISYLNDQYALGTEDYLRMYGIQKKFASMWETTGERFIELYGGKEGNVIKSDIQSKLDVWDQSISERTWASVTGYLEGLGFEIPPFDDKESFFTSLNDYIEQQAKISKEDGVGAASYPLFQDFKTFWTSTFKENWAGYAQESDVLTLSQISYLDAKIHAWEEVAKPKSYNLHLLLGFTLVLIMYLVYITVKQRKYMLY